LPYLSRFFSSFFGFAPSHTVFSHPLWTDIVASVQTNILPCCFPFFSSYSIPTFSPLPFWTVSGCGSQSVFVFSPIFWCMDVPFSHFGNLFPLKIPIFVVVESFALLAFLFGPFLKSDISWDFLCGLTTLFPPF